MIFGIASLLAVGYFIYEFLTPPVVGVAPAPVISTGLDTEVVNNSKFQLLQEFVTLPIKAGTVGRANPFANIAPAPLVNNPNVNANANANANANSGVNVKQASGVNSPAIPATPSGNTP